MKKTINGFTIVELLIVIVVIAILAAISVVSYTGIQDRANDTAVKNDLASLAKIIQLAAADTGSFPAGAGTSTGGNWSAFPNIKFQPSKKSYSTSPTNLLYCEGVQSGKQTFILAAQSKSLANFIYTPEGGLQTSGSGPSSNCSGSLSWMSTGAYGYHPSYGWSSWTNS